MFSSTSGASQPPDADRPAKVAIPRLNRQQRHEPPPKQSASRRPRVSVACRSCRTRKVRCNGGKPTCANCQESAESCVYDENRRNRLRIATDQIEQMKTLLQDIRTRTSKDDRRKIDNVLAQIIDEDSMIQDMMEISQSSQQEETHEENNFPAQRDSDEDVDVLEDYMTQEQERQASGFIGKSSELRLLRQLHLKAGDNRGDPFEHQNPYPGSSASMETVLHHTQSGERHQRQGPVNPKDTNVWSFYLDNCDLHPDLSVQAFELPSRQTAERLVNSYLTTVQPTFPILAEPPFKTEFDQLYTTSSNSSNTTNRWLGILNLVFAIGRRHQDLAEDIRPPDDSEHQVYWSRAHVLGLELFHSVEHADTTQLQASSLLAMYLLSVGHVNRAWIVNGFSLRLAHALGLHVKNESRTANATQKEVQLRMWWGVYSLEGHLSITVGQPHFVNESHCSAFLPLSLSTEQLSDESFLQSISQRPRRPAFRPSESGKETETAGQYNGGSYLKSTIELSILTQKVMTELYSAVAVNKPWSHTRQVVKSLCNDLDDWLSALPTRLNFSLQIDHTSMELERERLVLHMQYISTRILITRPCVCRFGSHDRAESENFNQQTAKACVRAAKELTNLLPVHSHVSYLYKIGPWWSVVHNLMQALIVLLLEMSYGTTHLPGGDQEILISIKKLIRSLRTMSKNNQVAKRAYAVAFQVLRGMASKLNTDISDLVWEDIAHSSTPNLDTQASDTNLGQQYASPMEEVGQVSRDLPIAWNSFYDNQSGHMSMFYNPTTPHLNEASLGGQSFPIHEPHEPASYNPFMTIFDEENPFTAGEKP